MATARRQVWQCNSLALSRTLSPRSQVLEVSCSQDTIQRATKGVIGGLIGSASVEMTEGAGEDFEMLSLDKAGLFLAEKHIYGRQRPQAPIYR